MVADSRVTFSSQRSLAISCDLRGEKYFPLFFWWLSRFFSWSSERDFYPKYSTEQREILQMGSKRCPTSFSGWCWLSAKSAAGLLTPLAERVHSLLTVPSAENAPAQKSNVANVPNAPVFSPHFDCFPLFCRDLRYSTKTSILVQIFVRWAGREVTFLI